VTDRARGRSVGRMIRRLLPVLAIVAALLAFGATAPARAPSRRGVPTTAANKRAAEQDARRLLDLAVLPSGAEPASAGELGGGWLLRRPASQPALARMVDRHAFWRVPAPLDSVAAFVQAHAPAHAQQAGWGISGGPGVPPNRELTFTLAPVPGRILDRLLSFTLVALPGAATGVRIDAEDVWIVTRARSERLPQGVSQIGLRSGYPGRKPSVSVTVTDPAQVSRIVEWVNALGIVQPGAYSCPNLAGPTVTLDFLDRAGAMLAQASVIALEGTSGPCNPVALTIGGRRQTPLIGGDLLLRIQRLLHVRLTSSRVRASA
jgi:hypothetical protein